MIRPIVVRRTGHWWGWWCHLCPDHALRAFATASRCADDARAHIHLWHAQLEVGHVA